MIIAPFLIALLVSLSYVPILIPRLRRAGIVEKDLHKLSAVVDSEEIPRGAPRGIDNSKGIPRGKPVHPEVPEMGGDFGS